MPTPLRAPGATSPMPPAPPAGARVVRAERRVRLGDVRPDGLARLDAVARWCQDIAVDDVRQAGVERRWRWVVRRTMLEVVGVRPAYDRPIAVATWCAGTGAAWAERRTTVTHAGGRVEVSAVWVALDPDTMRPVPLGDDFDRLYGAAAGGRRVKANLLHEPTPPPDASTREWPLRLADLDALGHLNNAIAWAILDELVPDATGGSVEYRDQVRDGPLLVRAAGRRLWLSEPGTAPAVTAEVMAT